MTSEFKLPDLGENIESGDVVNVLVSEGDTVNVDDPIIEIETDKATIEVPSGVSGVIKSLHVQEGDTVQVGQLILTTEDGAGQPAESAPEAAAEAKSDEDSQQPETDEEDSAVAIVEAEAPEETFDSEEPILVEFKLPGLGENVEAGTVVGILVSVGDSIVIDQGVLELETDKATVEVPVSVGGTVKEIHVSDGDEISVGQTVLTVETTKVPRKRKAPPPPPPEFGKVESAAVSTKRKIEETSFSKFSVGSAGQPKPRTELTTVPAAPNVRRLAREIGVEVSQVSGTGPLGRISMDDVKRHSREMRAQGVVVSGRPTAAPLPDFSRWGEVERRAMSNIRRATAKHMDLAWSTIPHVTQFDKADITELEQLRKRFGKKVEEVGGRLTITAILLKVVAAALKEFPQFNASIDISSEEIVYKQYYHIGVAADTDRGLLVPVIRDVDQKNIMELAIELGQMAEKARAGKLSLDEMQGGNFTLTNLGGIGGTNFTPIINAPEVAILGVGRGRKEPVFNKDGSFEPRLMLPLALSYDHRVIDGADGARFIRWIVEYLEQPFLTALQGW